MINPEIIKQLAKEFDSKLTQHPTSSEMLQKALCDFADILIVYNKQNKKPPVDLKEIRTAVADYIATEGCSCCQDVIGHKLAMDKIGKLLKMQKYEDNSGFNYRKYISNKR